MKTMLITGAMPQEDRDDEVFADGWRRAGEIQETGIRHDALLDGLAHTVVS